jgi:LPS export ABC transporter protein LptC
VDKIILSAFILLYTSCSLDYSDANIIEDLAEEIPNTIIFQYESVEIQDGSPVLQIKADKAEVYNSREITLLTDVLFFNYKDNKIDNRGASDLAELNMKTGNAQLLGSILIESLEDEKSLSASSLAWVENEKRLSSSKDDSVTIIDSDGSNLSGLGFSADIKRKTILFDGKTKGKYTTDEN